MRIAPLFLLLALCMSFVSAAGEANLKTKVEENIGSTDDEAKTLKRQTRSFLELERQKEGIRGFKGSGRKDITTTNELVKEAKAAFVARQHEPSQPVLTQFEASTLNKLSAQLSDLKKAYRRPPVRRYPNANSYSNVSPTQAKSYGALSAAYKNQQKLLNSFETPVQETTTPKSDSRERKLREEIEKLTADLAGAGDFEIFEDDATEPAQEQAQESKEPAQEQAQESKEPAQEQAQESKEPAQEQAQESKESAQEQAQESKEPAQEQAQESKEPAQEQAQEFKEPAQEQAQESKESAQEQAQESKESAQEQAQESKEPAQESDKSTITEVKEPEQDNQESDKSTITEVEEPKDQEPAQEQAQESKEPAQEQAQESKEPAQEQAQESKEPAQEQAQESKEPAQEQAQETKEPAKESAQDSKEPAKESAQDSKEPAKESPAESKKDESTTQKEKSDDAVALNVDVTIVKPYIDPETPPLQRALVEHAEPEVVIVKSSVKKANETETPSTHTSKQPINDLRIHPLLRSIMNQVNSRVIDPEVLPQTMYSYRLKRLAESLNEKNSKITKDVSTKNKMKWQEEMRKLIK